jgi:hypothetical protein
MTTLWQQVEQAGWDPRIFSIAIIFVDARFFLLDEQECPDAYREFIQKLISGDATSRNRVRDMMISFYKDKNPLQNVNTDTACNVGCYIT